MKKANEIAVITKKAVQEKMAERHDTTMTFINNTIAKAIERNAKNGDYSLKIKVSESLDRDLIERVLTEHGYDVKIKGYEVSVDWLKEYVKV